MLIHEDRAGVEEQYSQACTSSNLRCEADKRGPADILIASGMSNSRIGGALMRLRTEFGSDSVPRRSATATDHRLLMARLKTLPSVLAAVTAQAQHWGIDRPEAVALAVVSHFLDNLCRHCEGRGKKRIEGTPALSAINCKHCGGTGRVDLSHGSAGRRVESFIADCINDWGVRTKKLLREMR